jgi:hypothetical protein
MRPRTSPVLMISLSTPYHSLGSVTVPPCPLVTYYRSMELSSVEAQPHPVSLCSPLPDSTHADACHEASGDHSRTCIALGLAVATTTESDQMTRSTRAIDRAAVSGGILVSASHPTQTDTHTPQLIPTSHVPQRQHPTISPLFPFLPYLTNTRCASLRHSLPLSHAVSTIIHPVSFLSRLHLPPAPPTGQIVSFHSP